jgi:hypothetical protein
MLRYVPPYMIRATIFGFVAIYYLLFYFILVANNSSYCSRNYDFILLVISTLLVYYSFLRKLRYSGI